MLKGIDISHWQSSFDISTAKPGFCIVKATEGVRYVDKSCDKFVRTCIKNNIPFGYYHFANGSKNAAQQARYFQSNTKGYEKKGIPVLDYESAYGSTWIDEFVHEYHAITGVFPWVYMSASYVNDRKYGSTYVKQNCGLWLAGYPQRYSTYPSDLTCPYKHAGWTLAAWQFTDNLRIDGDGIDGDVFYGNVEAWNKYATGGTSSLQTDEELADRVITGEFGNGAARRKALGKRYEAVQAIVNQRLKH